MAGYVSLQDVTKTYQMGESYHQGCGWDQL